MRIIVRATASKKMGSGHIMRCITLAEELSKKNDNIIEFVTQNFPENLDDLIKKKGFIVHSLKLLNKRKGDDKESFAFDQDQDASETIKAIKNNIIDLIIVDHYSIDYKWERKLRPFTKKIMVIDDLANRRHDCDFVLDQNYINNQLRYENLVSTDTIKLLGPRFALLREEFYTVSQKRKKSSGKNIRLFVFFGGSDLANLTSLVLKVISKSNFKGFYVDVVIGSLNPHKEKIQYLVSKSLHAKLHIQVDNIAILMSKADIALCAGGSSTWERMSLGLPSLIVTTAVNQEALSNDLYKDGYINLLGSINNVNERVIEDALQLAIQNPDNLQLQSQKCKNLVDSLGARRVSNLLLGDIKAKDLFLREANDGDCDLYWHWANDPIVRENAYQQQQITLKNHQIWYKKNLNSPNVIMLVVDSEYGPLAQVRFDRSESNFIISYSLAMQFRGFGLGKTIISKAIEYLRKFKTFTVIAEVKESNVSSRKIFEKVGFNQVSKSLKYNQQIFTFHMHISRK